MSTVVKHIDGMCPWPDVMRMTLCLCHLPPKNVVTQSNPEKNIRQTQTEGQSTKYLTSPHNCQGHQKQGKSEKLSQSRGA